MATNYPGGFDLFQEPSNPEAAALSSAGLGGNTRNHIQHHIDLGDAIEAIQHNVPQATHAHSGVGLDGPKLIQANTHQSADTDSTPTSIHHTIGLGGNQAAAGNHVHANYVDLGNTQSISGKKTFPAGTNSPVIPDFTNSNHHHYDNPSGGIVSPAVWINQFDAGVLDVNQSQVSELAEFANLNSKYGGKYGVRGTVHIALQITSTIATANNFNVMAAVALINTDTLNWNNSQIISWNPNGITGWEAYAANAGPLPTAVGGVVRANLVVPFATVSTPNLNFKLLMRIASTGGHQSVTWKAFTHDFQLYPLGYAISPNSW